MPVFSSDDLRRCIEVLEAIDRDRTLLAGVTEEERIALLVAAGHISRPTRHERARVGKAFRKVVRKETRAIDRDLRDGTEIRAARRAAVYVAPPRLVESAAADAVGHGDADAAADRDADAAAAATGHDGAATEGTGAARASSPSPAVRELARPRACYVCKTEYRRLHFFYDAMCPPCAALNYEKRFQTAPLHGRVALITGARVKIGFHAALKMLRAGARVLVTTRFPNDAAQRYAREPDFDAWKTRLAIYGLDLRHAPSVELFARYLVQTEERLDILINNAAQTVRRPPGFYAHLLDFERRSTGDLPAELRPLLAGFDACKRALTAIPAFGTADAAPAHALRAAATADAADTADTADGRIAAAGELADASPDAAGLVAWYGREPGIGLRASAALSQLPYAYEDGSGGEVFPEGRTDADLQQVDLRTKNSWRLTLAEVPSAEMLEVHLVNAVAPFVLASKLKPLFLRHPTGEKHIVNVSAMEGIFSRHTKTDKHPHTNMAKAALNMMTLTSAPDYARDGIFMNAVDTGWVTDEDPTVHAVRKQIEHDFQPPLDIVDGAARICDPFFSGLLGGTHLWGKFLKDYAPTTW